MESEIRCFLVFYFIVLYYVYHICEVLEKELKRKSTEVIFPDPPK